MSVAALRYEAGIWLSFIHGRFLGETASHPVRFPLTDLASCRAFARCVTETMNRIRSADCRLPPMALILTMIDVCDSIAHPASSPVKATGCIPRGFAYEMLDRLRAEIPATFDFALDQVGRIITEAGTQDDATRMRRAHLTFHRRMEGAFAEHELARLMGEVWQRRFPASRDLLIADKRRQAA